MYNNNVTMEVINVMIYKRYSKLSNSCAYVYKPKTGGVSLEAKDYFEKNPQATEYETRSGKVVYYVPTMDEVDEYIAKQEQRLEELKQEAAENKARWEAMEQEGRK